MFFDVLLIGIMVGAIYTLVTIGYSMVYSILKLMNFAHGDVYIFGTFICYTLLSKYSMNPLIAILIAALLGGLLASLVEVVAYRRLRSEQHRMISMITALGAAYVIQNSNELQWGNQVLAFPSILTAKTFQLFGFTIPITQIIILVIAVSLIAVFTLFLKYHPYGKAILCVSEDIPTASLMGIPINKTITMVYFIGGMLGVVGGILYSTSYNAVSLAMGFRGTIIAFTAAVIGGIGSLGGALVGGMLLGICENFIGVYVSSSYRDPITFLLLILILLVKPTGIMGSVDQSKV
ncbi:MAG: branched-chain amino acid ABC transporter permease [Desulfamplus sp.]|nr:branched-chain amino acid ABC transporter permease [Desulfamplus sp.]MBF0211136.1 branched-chain amino acid ABC transporter permease [Desulfamplus sp.]MBF0242223.1 branched-chain amino acid ABC transporter permease [Desulfamplus sp.]